MLIIYDNGSYIHWPPLGLMYVASVLRNNGHEVLVYSQDKDHSTEEDLAFYITHMAPDVVGLSFCAGYYQHAKAIEIGRAVRAQNHKPFFVIGGHGPAPEPEYFMSVTGADAVVCGEGELIACQVIEERKPGAHRANLQADVDSLPLPAWDLFPMDYYRLLRMPHCKPTDFVFPVLSGRGCPFKCNFCYRMDDGFRPRSTRSIQDECRQLRDEYGINYIAFGDELLMNSKARAKDIAEAMGALGVRWECCGRLNYATQDVLSCMRDNGCVFINYGIEAVDDAALKAMHKSLTVDQITRGVEATIKAGISPGLNIIWGNYCDTPETLAKGVDFILEYDDGAQLRTIRPVTPYPGSPLYYDAIKAGLLTGPEDFYRRHVNSDLFTVNFMGMSNEAAHRELCLANRVLIEHYHKRQAASGYRACEQLYSGDATFRGFRQS